ncbi:hypothetical protein C1646_765507 [Rhizophagus diaphanus]|nr:hypothetical protein C1646_765507 [Rhizophagus diaphanus] [Rhizophagus sp. MUCL 43196]
MPDELLTLRHKRALELLQKLGKKEHLEECAKKSFNLTALKEWEEDGEPFEDDDEVLAFIEYKESKAYKNGVIPESENNPIPSHNAKRSE